MPLQGHAKSLNKRSKRQSTALDALRAAQARADTGDDDVGTAGRLLTGGGGALCLTLLLLILRLCRGGDRYRHHRGDRGKKCTDGDFFHKPLLTFVVQKRLRPAVWKDPRARLLPVRRQGIGVIVIRSILGAKRERSTMPGHRCEA